MRLTDDEKQRIYAFAVEAYEDIEARHKEYPFSCFDPIMKYWNGIYEVMYSIDNSLPLKLENIKIIIQLLNKVGGGYDEELIDKCIKIQEELELEK